jgi:hypothetical protein
MKKKTFWDADSSPVRKTLPHFYGSWIYRLLHNSLYVRNAQVFSRKNQRKRHLEKLVVDWTQYTVRKVTGRLNWLRTNWVLWWTVLTFRMTSLRQVAKYQLLKKDPVARNYLQSRKASTLCAAKQSQGYERKRWHTSAEIAHEKDVYLVISYKWASERSKEMGLGMRRTSLYSYCSTV